MNIIGAFAVPHPPLIIPEVGRSREQHILATADSYEAVGRQIAKDKPDVLAVITPHSVMYADYLHISPGMQARGDFGSFGVPQVSVQTPYDQDFANQLCAQAEYQGIPAGFLGEKDPDLDHGAMIPLYFIQKYAGPIPIVRISISGLSYQMHYQLGQCICQAALTSGKKTMIIASGDLSHKLREDGPYGFTMDGLLYDEKVCKIFTQGDFYSLLDMDPAFCESAAECGQRSFLVMAGAFDGWKVQSKLLSYQGPFGVGYAVAAFRPIKESADRKFLEKHIREKERKRLERKEHEDAYVRLAREALEHYIQTGERLLIPARLPQEFYEERAGAFVSLKIDGSLRGCIGTIMPTQSCIGEEIIENAISAAVRDHRFSPVALEELPLLTYSVDILGEPEPIQSEDQLDVKRYGVIVQSGLKRGLLLPDLTGVDTPQDQVRIALEKAGIPTYANYTMERFEVIRHL
ncbi:MAG: AmmeMemoRadiSam system protein A [Lachnospiraceae bacterium]|nr:AmmeMemoRadiSam system protein A [Lachnospiraceae bacterium]MCI9545940.1 AmmeMemoRadiSam system protein A [Lachnospiraceae bacterium]